MPARRTDTCTPKKCRAQRRSRDVPAPRAWLEFNVDGVEKATAELEARGYLMLVKNRKVPWGQTVSLTRSVLGR